jgi:hypothetical protein
MSSCEAEGVKGMMAFPRAYNELMFLVWLLLVEGMFPVGEIDYFLSRPNNSGRAMRTALRASA